MKCFIYRNLHKPNHTYSLKALEGPFQGRVIGYSSVILVNDVEFRVSVFGRDKVRKTGRKNVHAGVVGNVVGFRGYHERLCTPSNQPIRLTLPQSVQIVYSPTLYDTFVDAKTKEPVALAKQVLISHWQLLACGIVTA